MFLPPNHLVNVVFWIMCTCDRAWQNVQHHWGDDGNAAMFLLSTVLEVFCPAVLSMVSHHLLSSVNVWGHVLVWLQLLRGVQGVWLKVRMGSHNTGRRGGSKSNTKTPHTTHNMDNKLIWNKGRNMSCVPHSSNRANVGSIQRQEVKSRPDWIITNTAACWGALSYPSLATMSHNPGCAPAPLLKTRRKQCWVTAPS